MFAHPVVAAVSGCRRRAEIDATIYVALYCRSTYTPEGRGTQEAVREFLKGISPQRHGDLNRQRLFSAPLRLCGEFKLPEV